MNQRIIYSTPEGGVAVIIPAADCGLTIEQVAEKDVPKGAAFEIVEASTIPSDRTFRNAWERSGRAIGHNMPKARTIAHEKRRAARVSEFAPLDIEVTIPAQAAQAEAKRQAIRDRYADVQAQIDAATDVDALKAIVGAL